MPKSASQKYTPTLSRMPHSYATSQTGISQRWRLVNEMTWSGNPIGVDTPTAPVCTGMKRKGLWPIRLRYECDHPAHALSCACEHECAVFGKKDLRQAKWGFRQEVHASSQPWSLALSSSAKSWSKALSAAITTATFSC